MESRLEEAIMSKRDITELDISEQIAILVAVRWIAEHECPDGLGTRWHEICQELVKED